MYENATHLHARPGRLDECLEILRDRIVPILKGQPGLLGLALIPHPDQNEVSVLSMWESRHCACAIESDPAYRHAIRSLDALLVDPAFALDSPDPVWPNHSRSVGFAN